MEMQEGKVGTLHYHCLCPKHCKPKAHLTTGENK